MSSNILAADLAHTLDALSAGNRAALAGASILVTGCGGFLGYYAMQFLARHGETLGLRNVIGLDSFILSDMGGTTTDLGVFENGRPQVNEQGADTRLT